MSKSNEGKRFYITIIGIQLETCTKEVISEVKGFEKEYKNEYFYTFNTIDKD